MKAGLTSKNVNLY